jgi:VWFA-related protein
MHAVTFLAGCIQAALLAASSQQPTFRAEVDVVSVDVAVTDRSRPVGGLDSADFQLSDNGVAQRIELLSIEATPIDVSLVVDVSGSIADSIERFKSGVARIAALLRPDDRVRLLTFSSTTKQVFGFQSPAAAVSFNSLAASGTSSVYDAIGQVLMRGTLPARRHLMVAFTDGMDNSSVLAGTDLIEVARRAEGVLHVALLKSRSSSADDVSRAAAEATGGRLHTDTSPDDIERTFAKIFAEYRQAYVLRYTPQGVPRDGWHEITVKVVRPPGNRYTVRARRGYVGG